MEEQIAMDWITEGTTATELIDYFSATSAEADTIKQVVSWAKIKHIAARYAAIDLILEEAGKDKDAQDWSEVVSHIQNIKF
jgi:hypothetical protein